MSLRLRRGIALFAVLLLLGAAGLPVLASEGPGMRGDWWARVGAWLDQRLESVGLRPVFEQSACGSRSKRQADPARAGEPRRRSTAARSRAQHPHPGPVEGRQTPQVRYHGPPGVQGSGVSHDAKLPGTRSSISHRRLVHPTPMPGPKAANRPAPIFPRCLALVVPEAMRRPDPVPTRQVRPRGLGRLYPTLPNVHGHPRRRSSVQVGFSPEN